jgi:hypothetical protein
MDIASAVAQIDIKSSAIRLKMPNNTKVGHGYGKTRGFWVTGVTGTGTGWAFGNPRHTATRTRGIAGMYGYHYHR